MATVSQLPPAESAPVARRLRRRRRQHPGEDAHKATLDEASLKEGLRLVWFACGKEEFLVQNSKATVEMLKKHKCDVTEKDTEGGHTWHNWRDSLAEFAPMLYQGFLIESSGHSAP
jgi:enterochelin esterase-like enzyme